jgi:hypothetical protein
MPGAGGHPGNMCRGHMSDTSYVLVSKERTNYQANHQKKRHQNHNDNVARHAVPVYTGIVDRRSLICKEKAGASYYHWTTEQRGV